MIATVEDYAKLYGNIEDVSLMAARCACVACNSCTCACSCRIVDMKNGEIEW